MFYLTTQSTHFIYGYMTSDMWFRITQIMRYETLRNQFISYSFILAARDLLYVPSYKHNNIYNGLYYTGVTKAMVCAILSVERCISERNVLFNDAFNTFYLRLYGARHMIKDYSDSKRGNPLQPHGLLLAE